MRQLRTTSFTLALLASLAARSAAQEASRGAYVAPSCQERDGLSLCIDRASDQGKMTRRRERRRPTRFGRMARLAGMFMGRVEAAALGNLKLRFKLEIE